VGCSPAYTLPRSTEVERIIIQRVGQDIFRRGLLEYWDSRCAITGLAVPELLRASHVKPWADCGTDAERLDVFNGFLLAPNLDAVFDAGFITVGDAGEVLVSDLLAKEARGLLGLDQGMKVRGIADEHRGYILWHRSNVFRRDGS
jgi:putative restriction endonuclease